MTVTPTKIAVAIAVLIAIFIGGLVIVQTLRSEPWQIQIVPYTTESADVSIPPSALTPAAQSGTTRLYSGYSATPRTLAYEFIGSGGVNFDADWSSVRGNTATFTTASTLDSWTNPTTCAGGAAQCGHLVLAIPSQGAPQAPDYYSIDGAAEAAVADDWVLEHGSLDLRRVDFHVIRTVAADIPTGVAIQLRWLPWDGRGHLLPAP